MSVRKSQQPQVSVVVATYDVVGTLPRCLDSVLQQSSAGVELLVVDGGSTDGTREVLEGYADELAFWISEPDRGIYDAWNKALRRSCGNWVCFLGADDFFWESNSLERLLGALDNAEPERHRLVYGRSAVIRKDGSVSRRIGRAWHDISPALFRGMMRLPHPGMLHARTIFEEYGEFDTAFRIAGDYEMVLRELRSRRTPLFVPDVMVCGIQEGGVSRTHPFRALAENRGALRKHGLGRPGIEWHWAAAKSGGTAIARRLIGASRVERLKRRFRRRFPLRAN